MSSSIESPVRTPGSRPASRTRGPGLVIYFLVGIVFGIVLIKGEVISWFRIQEMFRFQGFHMYGVFATALPVAIITVQLMKRSGMRTVTGEPVTLQPKTFGTGVRYGVGGILFGLGWALTGACPGPLFALLGSGLAIFGVAIAAAILGTFTYGILRPKLPH
jgi:uncharacterized membrane protein YedE/YeeE